MKADLLESRFSTIEEPEGVNPIEVALEPQEIADAVKQAISLARYF